MAIADSLVFDRFGRCRSGLLDGFGGQLEKDVSRKGVVREMELIEPTHDRIEVLTGHQAEQDASEPCPT